MLSIFIRAFRRVLQSATKHSQSTSLLQVSNSLLSLPWSNSCIENNTQLFSICHHAKSHSRLISPLQASGSSLSLLCLNSHVKNNTQLFLTRHQLIDLVHLYMETLSLKLGAFYLYAQAVFCEHELNIKKKPRARFLFLFCFRFVL